MNQKQLAEAYKRFFAESEFGEFFLNKLKEFIQANHENAENDPNLSRDYVQRAKGQREVLVHINTVIAGVKKGGKPRVKE